MSTDKETKVAVVTPTVTSLANRGTELSQLLEKAVETNLDAAAIKEITALYEKVADRTAKGEFNESFAKFRENCPPIVKTKKKKIPGANFTLEWCPLDEMQRLVDPVLHPLGFSYHWDTTVSDNGLLLTAICHLDHVGGHRKPSRFVCPVEVASKTNKQWAYSTAESYAHRRSLASVLGITTTDNAGLSPGTTTPLTESQVADLETMVSDIEKTVPGARARFLKFALGDPDGDIATIALDDFSKCIRALEQMRKAKP